MDIIDFLHLPQSHFPKFEYKPIESYTMKNIMVIEDDIILQLVYKKLLGDLNVNIFTCSNIAEANTCINENHIDLIISDYNLPDATSLEFLKLVKDKREQMPMMLITANSHVRAENPEIDQTINTLLYKPVSYNEFLGNLNHHLTMCA